MPAPARTAGWTPNLLSAIRIATGLLFFQHGAEKIWGFAGGRIDLNFATMHGFAGPLEVVGGALIALGLFTRTTALILPTPLHTPGWASPPVSGKAIF